jgi:hypothetical protein
MVGFVNTTTLGGIMSKQMDEADLLFGNGRNISVVEGEFIFAMQAAGLSLKEKLRKQKEFRAADKDTRRAMLEEFCGPSKGDFSVVRQMLGL